MSEGAQHKPPAAWLDHLREAGHWDRLIEMSLKSLAIDPNDAGVHRHMAWAYAMKDRPAEMSPLVDFLLRSEPDDTRNQHLAAIFHLETKRHQQAKHHIDFLLRHEPRNATFHYLACIHDLRCHRVESARRHITEARALAPEWAAAAHLEIKMDGIHQKKASDAWRRIRRLEETLALDPQNAGVMTSVGDIFLLELERPGDAERHYRSALLIDPTDKPCQEKLLTVIRARSLFYRTLSLPSSADRAVKKALVEHRIRWLLALLFIKGVVLFLAWLIVIGIFFAPAAKVYEWFVLSEVTRIRRVPRFLSPLSAARAWPLWIRLSVSFGIIASAWILLLWKVFDTSPLIAFEIMAWTFGIHLALVSLVIGIRKLRARFGRWQENRRQRREEHPAVQSARRRPV